MTFAASGVAVFDHDPRVLAWAQAALASGFDPGPWRHGGTWAVGLDALANGADGSVGGVPLSGPWGELIDPPEAWHRAQLSTTRAGYPGRDADESDAAHRFRRDRDAAHVDGLLPVGPARRRFLREPHAFILGIPLTPAAVSPLVVWPGSHRIIGAALARAVADRPDLSPGDVDLTDAYAAARRACLAACPREPVLLMPGQAVLLHRHLLHGVAPWDDAIAQDRRIVAYFRPQTTHARWLLPA